jgi:8-oxo-dGTP pyrophosphatase MutT (NUDIX family)
MTRVDPDEVRRRLHELDDVEPTLDLEEIRREWIPETDLTDAAVLIPITHTESGLHVVLTQRAASLRKHSGEMSFPGGRRDPEDADLIVTALRESHEEIALLPEHVEVYGALLQMPTVTGYEVTVFVGEFPWPYALEPNPAEIDEIVVAPLETLADPGIHRREIREWDGKEFPIHFFDYGPTEIWGATGFMLDTLLHYLGLRG